MGKMFQAATNYLPAQVSGMMSQDRAFATVRLNISGQRNICALSTYVLTLLPLGQASLASSPCLQSTCCGCCCVSVWELFGLRMLFPPGFRSCLGCW